MEANVHNNTNIKKRKSANNNNRRKKSKKGMNPLFILLFFIFPIAALLIPYLVFRSNFDPVLTQKMADELIFAKYLASHSSHTFADGWVSTKPFVPLSTRYFLTYYISDYTTWKDALLSSVSCVYAIFAGCYLFFVTSLHAKKFYTYIIAAIPAVVLSVIGLKAVYDCSYLLTIFCLPLICLGIVIHGIRFKIPVPFRAAIALLAIIPVIAVFSYMNNMKKDYSFDNTDLLSVNLSAKEEAVDITDTYKGLTDFMETNSISCAFCTDTIVNEVSIISNEKVEVAPVVSPEDLSPVELETDSLKNPYEKVTRESKPFYMIYDSATANKYASSLYLQFGTSVYSDEHYTVYSYKNVHYFDDKVFQNDIISLASSQYDSFYYSFLGSNITDGKDFPRFLGVNPIFIAPADVEYDDTNMLLDKAISKDGLKAVFLEIDPIALSKAEGKSELEYLNGLAEKYADVAFYTILSYPSSDYWKSLSETEMKEKLETYESVIKFLTHNDNVSMYWPGSEKWLVESKSNYNSGVPAEDVALNLLILCTCNLKYTVDKDSVTSYEDAIKTIVSEDYKYSDLSDREIVFFGDSIFGNYHGPISIPGAATGLSGADTYNLGIGGTSAIGDFNKIVNLFVGSSSSSDIENPDFWNEFDRFKKEHDGSKKLCFVINYGVNDYFMGVPAKIGSGTPYEDYAYDSYESAMTDGIIKLKSSFPDSTVYILSPIYCDYFESGSQVLSNVGSNLQTYRNVGAQIAEKTGIKWIDSMTLIEINSKNHKTYLVDGVHPTPDGIYLISNAITKFMGDN